MSESLSAKQLERSSKPETTMPARTPPRPSPARTLVPGFLLAVLLPMGSACAQTGMNDPAPGPALETISVQEIEELNPNQLRRLAGIIDMHRNGDPIYVALRAGSDASLCTPAFAGPDSAQVALDASQEDGEYRIYGPFITPEGPSWETEVVRVQVTLEREGEQWVREVDLERVDALFLTPSATERFLVPYLVETYGLEPTYQWYTEFLMDPAVPAGHIISETSCAPEGVFRY